MVLALDAWSKPAKTFPGAYWFQLAQLLQTSPRSVTLAHKTHFRSRKDRAKERAERHAYWIVDTVHECVCVCVCACVCVCVQMQLGWNFPLHRTRHSREEWLSQHQSINALMMMNNYWNIILHLARLTLTRQVRDFRFTLPAPARGLQSKRVGRDGGGSYCRVVS